MTDKQQVAPEESSESNVQFIRGQQVMLSTHLAEAYGIRQQTLHHTIERNIECFPEGSLFRLDTEEITGLEFQAELPDQAVPYAFTGHGVALLASILFDELAIHESQEERAPTCGCRD